MKSKWSVGIVVFCIVMLALPVAANTGEVRVTAILDEHEVTDAVQVMVMTVMPPLMVGADEEKVLQLPPGNHTLMVLFADHSAMVMPAQKQVTVIAGEVIELTVTLQGLGDVTKLLEQLGGAPAPSEPEFDPKTASEQELRQALTGPEELQQEALAELFDRHQGPFLTELLTGSESKQLLAMEFIYPGLARTELGPTTVERLGLLDQIMDLLSHSNSRIRGLAAKIVGGSWDFPNQALPQLVEALGHEDPYVRASAAEALGRRQMDSQVLQPLAQLVKEDLDAVVREKAVAALIQINKWQDAVVDALHLALSDRVVSVRLTTLERLRLSAHNPPGSLAAPVAFAVVDSSEPVRISAAGTLAKFDAETLGPLAPLFAQGLNDPSSAVKDPVLRILRSLEPAMLASLVPMLIATAEDSSARTRELTMQVLTAAGPVAAAAQAVIFQRLQNDENRNVRGAAALALAAIAPDDPQTASTLVAVLHNDEENTVRSWAAQGLGELGPSVALVAVPALAEVLTWEWQPNRTVIVQAREALGAMGSAAVEPMIALLHSEDVYQRTHGAVVLFFIGEEAEKAVPTLKALFFDEEEDPTVRVEARRAVQGITGEWLEH